MIIEFLLDMIYGFLNIILTPLSFIVQPIGDMSGLVELLAYGSIFIPIPTFVSCLTIWFGYYVLRFVMQLINWGIAKIPTIE